jgi:hypothetical protein
MHNPGWGFCGMHYKGYRFHEILQSESAESSVAIVESGNGRVKELEVEQLPL